MSFCVAIKQDGTRCKRHAMRGSDYCFWHTPGEEFEAKRHAARSLGGRGSAKLSAETKEDIVRLFADGITIESISEKLNIARATIYYNMRNDLRFRRAIEEAKAARTKLVEDALYVNALSGNFSAQRFFLINRAPDEWSDRAAPLFGLSPDGMLEVRIRVHGETKRGQDAQGPDADSGGTA